MDEGVRPNLGMVVAKQFYPDQQESEGSVMAKTGEPIIGTGTFPGSAFSEEPAVRKADYDALRAQVAAPFSLASGQPPVMTDDARLVWELLDEADWCRNKGSDRIALLLERAASTIKFQSPRELASTPCSPPRSGEGGND